MKTIVLSLSMLVLSISLLSQQTLSGNSIGLQANIFLDENLYTGSTIQPLWALRYGYKLNKKLSIGPEISGTRTYFRSMNIRDTKSTTMTLGGFGTPDYFINNRHLFSLIDSIFISKL